MYEDRKLYDSALGPLKIFSTTKNLIDGELSGWFYPLFVTRQEAIQEDLNNGGKGIYRPITFYDRFGEFYYAESFNFKGIREEPLSYITHNGNGAENPFARIQNNLSALVPDQLPDFIQTDYSTFVTFLKAYYEFLEQNEEPQEILQNITKYADIDETAERLIEQFLKTYAEDYTLTENSDNRFIIKRIRDIYKTKGTSKAYETLFYILYKETIDFFYPGNYVLKSSSGKWIQNYVVRIRPTNTLQNFYEFENTEIVGKSSGAKAIVKKVTEFDLGSYEIYELQLNSDSVTGFFISGEIIEAQKIIEETREIITLRAELYPILSKIEVNTGALGYELNNPVTIIDSIGNYAVARISGVNKFGSITKLDILDPGVNYSENTVIDSGLPTKKLNGTYILVEGRGTLLFSEQHGLSIGNKIKITYSEGSAGEFSPVTNSTHEATVVSVPNIRTIRYRYPGF